MIWIQNHKFLKLSGLYGGRKIFLSYRSDIQKIDLIEYRKTGNTWKNNQKI